MKWSKREIQHTAKVKVINDKWKQREMEKKDRERETFRTEFGICGYCLWSIISIIVSIDRFFARYPLLSAIAVADDKMYDTCQTN